jgi:hypothetical protein
MVLKGDAKTAYQREYMRRYRAGLKPTPKAKPAAAAPAQDVAESPALAAARAEIARLQAENTKLVGKIAMLEMKIYKPPPERDPESEARKALKKKINKASAVRAKIAKALIESTTTPANRLDAIQAWNALGLNKIGK